MFDDASYAYTIYLLSFDEIRIVYCVVCDSVADDSPEVNFLYLATFNAVH